MDEGTAREAVGAQGADALIGIISDALAQQAREGVQRFSERTRAMIVWDYMVRLADERLPALGVERLERQTIPFYVFDDSLGVRMKKHDRNLLTRNHPSDHQRALATQGSIPGLPDIAHASCGYVLDEAQAGLELAVVVYRVHGRLIWWIDLADLASGNMEPTVPILPFALEPAAPLPAISSTEQGSEEEDDDL